MKTKIFLLLVVITGFLCHSANTAKETETAPSLYPMMGVVTEVNYATDTVTIVDFNGNEWEFSECEDWFVGDVCASIMSDNGTPLIFDDEIVQVKYDGWLDGWINQ